MKVSFKDDHMPEGTELYVRGLGMLENGKSSEFSKEQVEAFEALTGKKLLEAFIDDDRVAISDVSAKAKGGDGN